MKNMGGIKIIMIAGLALIYYLPSAFAVVDDFKKVHYMKPLMEYHHHLAHFVGQVT